MTRQDIDKQEAIHIVGVYVFAIKQDTLDLESAIERARADAKNFEYDRTGLRLGGDAKRVRRIVGQIARPMLEKAARARIEDMEREKARLEYLTAQNEKILALPESFTERVRVLDGFASTIDGVTLWPVRQAVEKEIKYLLTMKGVTLSWRKVCEILNRKENTQ